MASSSKSEQAYIRSSLLSKTPLRPDGRALDDYRPIALETQVVPLANGSARVNIGGAGLNGVGGGLQGTEVIAAVKLEVEDIVKGKGLEGGRMVCNVSCSPSAYPQLTGTAVDDLQYDLTAIVHDSLSHSSLRPKNLTILPSKKSWLLHLDLLILSDNGNIYDTLFLAAAAALRDTRVPRTRSIEYKARRGGGQSAVDRLVVEDVQMGDDGAQNSGLDTRALNKATDFDLTDYWDEGDPLICTGSWPICVTLNLIPPTFYLDASSIEESATELRIILLYSFEGSSSSLQGMRLIGPGETDASLLKPLLRQAEGYARKLQKALDVKLQSEYSNRYPKQKGGNLKATPVVRVDLSGTSYEVRKLGFCVCGSYRSDYWRASVLRIISQVGFQHGTLLRVQILSQLTVYRTIFRALSKLEWPQVLEYAKAFQPTIQRLAPDLYREIEGIAAGVGDEVTLFDILALNARSEIALGRFDDGCTSLGWTLDRNPNSRIQILAQNWDWTESVGENLALASITQPGKPKIWMVIEPGIVGKIGFNSASVGICLNAIRAGVFSTELLPIHLLLRIALECTSIDSAISELERLGGPASSQHFLIADATSGSRGLEISPRGNAYLSPDAQGIVVHTNHFLENKFIREVPWLSGSPVRLARIRKLCEEIRKETLANKEGSIAPELLRAKVFSDKHGAPQAICCHMEAADGRAISTLFNIIMHFGPGKEPYAEVLFGRPGPDNVGPIYKMPCFSPSPPGTPLSSLENRPLPHDSGDTPRARAHTLVIPQHNDNSRRRKNRDADDDDEGTVVGVDDHVDAKDAESMMPGCGRTLFANLNNYKPFLFNPSHR
ncbi:hypothetical protein EW145_g1657 [Phellinidium pouzarii]|uniref:Uncharacterized protein n=1 Tax=Phellinidium pouzarii TaxID=167371 RepID=A0A4S4LE56_9AGAM|nr:hypothetical protein EW145_g1657 [Phellinidium pouzarii]